MADIRISQLPVAPASIDGTELVPVVQNGLTVQTTVSAITQSPSLTATFLTVNQEPLLSNSRALSAGVGIGITDGGAQSTYNLSLNGTSGSLEVASTGVIVKSAANTITARTLTASGNGISVTDGNGVSGNPTFQLTGLAAAIANMSGTGLIGLNSTTLTPLTLIGVANEISVADGNGAGGNPTIGIADNAVFPGVAGVTLPNGTTAERGATLGQIRYNTTSSRFEGNYGTGWQNFGTGDGAITSIGGATNQIVVSTVGGAATVSIDPDPVIPGVAAIQIPAGTTAQRPGGINGQLRYNSTIELFEGYSNGVWGEIATRDGVNLVETGTGLTGGPITSTGTVSIANTAVTAASYGSATAVPTYTVNAQGQLIAAADVTIAIPSSAITDKGLANGVATLDSGGKVPVSELPAAVLGALSYQGTWNASTNTPTLASGVGVKGYYYVVSVAGTTDLDGVTDWQIGDWAVYSGTAWQKIDNTDAVTSVNGLTGAVVLTTTNVAEGTNEYFTTARARTSISAGTGISYDSGTGVITNASPDQTVSIAAGTGITTSGTYPNFTVTNAAPDQTVSLTGAGTTVITGAYPSFTITSNDSTTGTVTSVAASAGTGISVTGSPITTSGTINITNTAPDQTVVLTAGTGISTSGTYPNFTITNTAPSSGGTVTSVTGTAPVVSSGGNTPAISMAAANTTTNGYLTSTDWNTFNNKTSNTGTVTSVSATVPSFLSVTGSPITTSGTLAISLSGTALPVANGGTGATTLTGYVKGAGTTALTASATIPNTDISGLGTMSTQNANSVAVTGGSINGTSLGATTASSAKVTTLDIASGLTLATNAGTSGQVLTSSGAGVVPTWSNPAAAGVTSISFGTTGLTPSTATSGVVSVAGTLAIANGGTGATTNTNARTNLGATTLGSNIFTITNPSAITFPRFNADNTVSALDAPTFRTAIGAGTGSGTVTGVTATAPVASSGGAAPAISLNAAYGDTLNPYGSKTANFVLAAPNGTAGVPTFRAVVAADIPTLNQSTTGNAATATTLQTARTINGVSFNGSANITITANTPNTLTRGTYLTGNNFNGSAATTWAVDATTTNTASKIVARDGSGNFSAGTITAALTGNATTATTLQTARTINNVSFNGSANITVEPYVEDDEATNATRLLVFVDNTTAGFKRLNEDSSLSYNPSTNVLTAGTFAGSGASLTTLNASNLSSGTVAIARGGTNGSATPTAGTVAYGTGTAYAFTAAGTSGQVLQSNGSGAPTWVTPAGGVTLSNDTSTATDLYPTFASATSGSVSTIFTGNSRLLYKPSTGELKSTTLVATNGIVVNSATVNANYTIPTGSNAISAGPVTVASGVTVTVSSGSVWAIV